MLRAMAIILCLSCPASAGMFDDWTAQDWQRQVAATTLLAADWAQTRHISKSDDYYEKNLILGERPDISAVNIYFAACIIGSWIAADLMPAKWRKHFQMALISMETACVGHNISAGVKFDF